MQHTAHIALGSNLGDRFDYLCRAIEALENQPRLRVLHVSHFYETEPLTLQGEAQHWYLNAVLKVRTSLNPIRLLHVMLEIEKTLGRERQLRWGPRSIDLDLLLFDQEIIKSPFLTLPHPEYHLRRFVLEPLAEISPKLVHPVLGLSTEQLLQKLEDNKKVVPLYKFQLRHSSEGVLKVPFRDRF